MTVIKQKQDRPLPPERQDGVSSQLVWQELETMSPAMLEQVLTFARFLKYQQQSARAVAAPERYDFADLAGKLAWRGDAVVIQRALRDEW